MGKFEIEGEGRRLVALLVSLAGLQVACYYLAAAWVNGAGPLPPPQPDTLLYCQSARRICEGQAFSFSVGTSVSTGTTSILYPFVLAACYGLGFTGESLLTAGFALNALFYICFLFGWCVAFRAWLPKTVAAFASVLLVLFHQTAYCALAQSDTGFWMALSGFAAATLATNRLGLAAGLLAVAPWVRPEGAVLALAIGVVAVFRRSGKLIAVGLVGLASAAGVFLFNRWLSGLGGFSSVANKGFFTDYGFAEAIIRTSAQGYAMLRELIFTTGDALPRGFYMIPVFGCLAVALGAYVWDWRRKSSGLVEFLLAGAGSFVLVAQSGFQGTNTDRYLAWLMPLAIVFSAVGFSWCRDRVGATARARVFLVVPVLYLAVTGVASVASYHLACADTARIAEFAGEMNRLMPEKASLGSGGWCGVAYFLGDRRVANLGGIYSPELSAKDTPGVLEILKNERKARFDYWMLMPEDGFSKVLADVLGAVELMGPSAFELRRADWSAFDRSAQPPSVKGKTLRCRVDVGYEADMRRSDYKIVPCYGLAPFKPLVKVADLGGMKAFDTGRMVIGYDEMTVEGLEPGKDMTICLRTADAVDAVHEDAFERVFRSHCSFAGEMGLHLSVDGREVACCHAHLREKGYNDVFLKLPGRFVTSNRHRIGVHGDHAAFAYWYYQ